MTKNNATRDNKTDAEIIGINTPDGWFQEIYGRGVEQRTELIRDDNEFKIRIRLIRHSEQVEIELLEMNFEPKFSESLIEEETVPATDTEFMIQQFVEKAENKN